MSDVPVSGLAPMAAALTTGVAMLDRSDIRVRAAVYFLKQFQDEPAWVTDIRLPRAVMCIVHTETGGHPENYLGDSLANGGPSVGPMQVYRATARAMSLWAPPAGTSEEDERALYAELAGQAHEAQTLSWGVAVFKDKLRQAKGDLLDAIRRYNGSGPAANEYRDRVVAFAQSRGWDFSPSTPEGAA